MIFLLVSAIIACSKNDENRINLEKCVGGWSMYSDKINAVQDSLRQLGTLDKYIVYKQGTDGSGSNHYWFLLIGTKDNDGVLLNMSGTIKSPVVEMIEYSIAEDLITQGKSNFQKIKDSELSLEVNHVPCSFFKYEQGGRSFEHSFSGLTNHMPDLHAYINDLTLLSIRLESEVERDKSDPLDGKNLAVTKQLKEDMKNNYFIELKGLQD
jgi:hypothetical protein